MAAESLSMIELFFQAGPVVKSVMIGLLGASIWSWAIIFNKIATLKSADTSMEKFEDKFWSGQSLNKLYKSVKEDPPGPMAHVFVSGMQEWRRSTSKSTDSGQSPQRSPRARPVERAEQAMALTIRRQTNRLERQMTFLASLGATAPFVGLFGTVWGIMNSFTSIAASEQTSLSVVAPGIAEALFATALGLVAAIPAVIAYNKFSNNILHYSDRLEAFATEFSSILARHWEERS